MRKSILMVALTLLFVGTSISRATLIGYVAEGKYIYRTDFETGQQTQLTLSLPFNTDYIEAMAVSPIDGSLYVVGHWAYKISNTQRGLYKIDPVTSDVTVISILLGDQGGLGTFYNLAISPDGTPYTVLNLNELFALPLDPQDSYTYIGHPTNTSFHTFAINSNGVGIGWDDKNSLRWLDLENATTTLAGEPFGLGENFANFSYGPDGTLYAWGDRTLYEINIDICTSIELGSFTHGGLPFAIAPEPTTPPAADAGSDQTVTDADDDGSEEITLDGSGSSDSDGTIVSWVWTDDLGDAVPDGEITTATLSVGTHNITLTVTDDDGLTDTDTVTITVDPRPNQPPLADAGSDQMVTDIDDDGSEQVTLDGSGSSDSDGVIVSWIWTDDLSDTIPDGEVISASLSVGVHTITLTVTDDDGLTDTDTATITVNPRPNQSPIANAGSDQTVGTGELVTLNGAGSYDPDEDYPLSYLWQIISKPAGSVAALSNSDTITPSFTPDQLGNYTVELVVTDSLDAQSVPDTTSISVLNTPPIADANGPYTVYVGDSLILDASGSTDADDDIASYVWDLDADDDGVFETDAGSQAVFTVDYTYLESLELLVNHQYTIHLKVTDSEDQNDIADSTLIIVPKPAVQVAVDIKPGSCPNPMNVKSSGVLPVAILGSNDYDITTIDPTSVRLAGVEPLRSGYEDIAVPVADSNDCNCIEAGPDGLLDLTLKFGTQAIVEAIGDVNHGDVLTLELTGVLYDPIPYETPIEGADCILIKGKYKAHNKADINKDGVVDAADFVIIAQKWLQSTED